MPGTNEPSKQGFSPSNGKNPRYYIDMLSRLFSSFGEKNPYEALGEIKRFFSWFGKISNAPTRVEVLQYIVINKAATIPMIVEDLSQSHTNVNRAVKFLEKEGILEKRIPVKHACVNGGRPPTMWALVGNCNQDELLDAIQRDSKRRIPVYSEVKKAKQLILEEYLSYKQIDEIKYSDILQRCKSISSHKYYSHDIARMVASEITREHALKVIM